MKEHRFTVQKFREVESTNTLAKEYAKNGSPDGLVIVADYQTAGRGKPGRTWVSPAGKDLLFSLLLRPPIPPHKAPLLTQIFCRSVAKVLKSKFRIQSTFKRPNDVLVDGKKICGVLVECVSNGNCHVESIIAGIGLNVNSDIPNLLPTATSIKAIGGKKAGRSELLKSLLRQIQSDLKGIYAHPA